MYFAYSFKLKNSEIVPSMVKSLEKAEVFDVFKLLRDKDFILDVGLIIYTSTEENCDFDGRCLLASYSSIIKDEFNQLQHKEFFSLDNQTILVKF